MKNETFHSTPSLRSSPCNPEKRKKTSDSRSVPRVFTAESSTPVRLADAPLAGEQVLRLQVGHVPVALSLPRVPLHRALRGFAHLPCLLRHLLVPQPGHGARAGA